MDIDKGSVSLRWARPADDGGDRIQGYIVEYKPVGGHWSKYNDMPIKELDCTGEFTCQFMSNKVTPLDCFFISSFESRILSPKMALST